MPGVLTTMSRGAVADVAEIKVLSTTVMMASLEELAPQFERETGRKIAVTYAPAAVIAKQIIAGETADVAFLTGTVIDDLMKQGKLVPGSRVGIARAGIGVAVRKGAPKPDISSPEALKRALLAARSVAYTDPATGGASGVHFMKVLERLGIAAEVQAKAKMTIGGSGGLVGDVVARGDAEIGVQMIPELMEGSSIDIIGPLPGELQSFILFAASIPVNAKEPEAGKALVKFLTTPASLSVIKTKGLESN
jgi:molybdate transport system substrate-binding protein